MYKYKSKSSKDKKVTRRDVQNLILSNSETKFHTNQISAVAVQDSGRTPLTYDAIAVTPGTGTGSRVGNQITITGFYARFALAAGDNSNIVRMILYISKEATTSMSGVGVTTLIDLDSFTVLYDKMHVVSTNGGPEIKAWEVKRSFTKKGKRKGITMQFDGAGATSYAKNALRWYIVSDSLAIPDPTLSGNIRTYYKDM